MIDFRAEPGCVVARLFRQVWLWSVYWRLYPLWDALRQAVPEIELPLDPAMRWNIRYRLYRRVIEIRDAQLALRPYASADVAAQAAAAAKAAGLPPDKAAALVEAAVIIDALESRLRGRQPQDDGVALHKASAEIGNDIRAEASVIMLMSQAIHRYRIIPRRHVRQSVIRNHAVTRPMSSEEDRSTS
jgi:hypothetical protein